MNARIYGSVIISHVQTKILPFLHWILLSRYRVILQQNDPHHSENNYILGHERYFLCSALEITPALPVMCYAMHSSTCRCRSTCWGCKKRLTVEVSVSAILLSDHTFLKLVSFMRAVYGTELLIERNDFSELGQFIGRKNRRPAITPIPASRCRTKARLTQ